MRTFGRREAAVVLAEVKKRKCCTHNVHNNLPRVNVICHCLNNKWFNNNNGVFDRLSCAVKCVSVYLQESTICGEKATESEVTKTSQGEVLTALQKSVHKLQWNVSSSGYNTAIALTRDELTNVLEDVAQKLVDAFQAVQMQVRRESK